MPDMENNTTLRLHTSHCHSVETSQAFSEEVGRGEMTSHPVYALTPLLGISTLTSSFSTVFFPPKNKCDTVLTLLSASIKPWPLLSPLPGLTPALQPVADHTISFKRLERLL